MRSISWRKAFLCSMVVRVRHEGVDLPIQFEVQCEGALNDATGVVDNEHQGSTLAGAWVTSSTSREVMRLTSIGVRLNFISPRHMFMSARGKCSRELNVPTPSCEEQ